MISNNYNFINCVCIYINKSTNIHGKFHGYERLFKDIFIFDLNTINCSRCRMIKITSAY